MQAHVYDERLLSRVLAELAEMPDLRLTVPQAARLWQIEPTACASILAALVEQRILTRTRNGLFVRAAG